MCGAQGSCVAQIDPTDQEIQEAALQFARKVSGYRKPSKVNEAAFNHAVIDIATSIRELLTQLVMNKEAAQLHHMH
jgi:hypothetical protein